MPYAQPLSELRQLRDDVASDVQQHIAGFTVLHAMTGGGKVFHGLQALQRQLIEDAQSHEVRLSAALEAMEAGRIDEALQLLGPDH